MEATSRSARLFNEARTLGRRIHLKWSLRPYGHDLLTEAAASWIRAVRVAIALMAAAEGMSWGYAAFYIATEGRWAASAIACVFIATSVVIMDSSLMTLDRSKQSPNRDGDTEKTAVDWKALQWWLDHASIYTRVGFVAASMYITAPFLTQLMFKADIDHALRQERAVARATQRSIVLQPLEDAVARVERDVADTRRRLELEMAGKGESGKYGLGKVALQMKDDLEALEHQRDQAKDAVAAAAAEYDGMTDEAISKRYGVEFPSDGFQERGKLLATIKNENFFVTELAVRAFLAFLFASLCLLKLFEPRSVKVYFSEWLHALYGQYQRRGFDMHLSLEDRWSENGGMEPLIFEDWCREKYPKLRDRETGVAKAALYRERLREVAEVLKEIQSDQEPRRAEQQVLETEIYEVDARVAKVEAELAEHESNLRSRKERTDGLERALCRLRSKAAIKAALEGVERAAAEDERAYVEIGRLREKKGQLERERSAKRNRLDDVKGVNEQLRRSRSEAERAIADMRIEYTGSMRVSPAPPFESDTTEFGASGPESRVM